jgi:lysophospholipase L1-like esterase
MHFNPEFKSVDLTEDGLHPNTIGHKKMFEVIKDFFIKNEIVIEGVEL